MTRLAALLPSALWRSLRLPLLALGVSVVASATLIDSPRAAIACASAPPRGEKVGIDGEEAVIVWDSKTKTEHFIRTASFVSSAKSFGFLVPTPTLPELGEVPRTVLDGLADALVPAVQYVDEPTRVVLTSLLMWFMRGDAKSGAATASAREVEIVGKANVAGMDATILKATDVDALAKWLADHGFDRSKPLDDWLAQYVQNQWYVTAFVIAPGNAAAPPGGDGKGGGGAKSATVKVASGLVRMSFRADAPFYPYREPAALPSTTPEVQTPARKLRVHVLSDQRMSAQTNGAAWSATTTWAAPITVPEGLRSLTGDNVYDTTFLDASSPRIGTDEVTFAPSADQTELRPPPQIIRVPHYFRLPIEAFVLGGGLLGMLAYVLLRKRNSKLAR